jgi:DNA-binding response OmpR family regulator
MRRRPSESLPSRLRIAAIERDGVFLSAISEQVKLVDWELVVHPEPVADVALLEGNPHAVLVDVDLLGPLWEEWLSRHPVRSPQLGVVVCTRDSTATQRIRGLRAGADDWIAKSCDPAELCARLEAIVRARRRGAAADELRPLRAGGLELRPDLYDALARERAAGLTHREFELLAHLARAAGRPVARERIYEAVWGFEMARGDRSIDTFVRKIRSKLKEVSPGWRYVHTHRSTGYSFAAKRAHEASAVDGLAVQGENRQGGDVQTVQSEPEP